MRLTGLFLFLIFATACGGQTIGNQSRTLNSQAALPDSQAKQAVLVELFTSEG